MTFLPAKLAFGTVVTLYLVAQCQGADIKIFTLDEDHGFATSATGKTDNLEVIFKDIFNFNDDYTFDFVSGTGTWKKYQQKYNGWLVAGSTVTVNYNADGSYSGLITGSIVTGLEDDLDAIGSPDSNSNTETLVKQAMGSAEHTMHKDTSKAQAHSQKYIRVVGVENSDSQDSEQARKTVTRGDRKRTLTADFGGRTFTTGGPTTTPIPTADKNKPKQKAQYTYIFDFLLDDEDDPSCPSIEMVLENGEYKTVGVTDSLQKYDMKGYGGNVKIGKYEYGSGVFEARPLEVTQSGLLCYLRNEYIDVDSGLHNAACSFNYHETFWEICNPGQSHDLDIEAYGQGHDALAFGTAFYKMLDQWYGDDGLFHNCSMFYICTHYGGNYDNAFYIPGTCNTYFGGGFIFYPLAVLDIVGHEIAHAYTHFTSGLVYNYCQSGSINEAFSDIAGETLEAYIRHYDVDWFVGYDVMKGQLGSWSGNRDALRFFDSPIQDEVSIDCANDFFSLDPHYGSGVFNKAFYILSNKCNWTIRRAFALFLHANHNYWSSNDGYYLTAYRVWYCAYLNTVPGYTFSREDAQDVADAFAEVGVIVTCPPGFWSSSYSSPNRNCPRDYRRTCFKIVNDVASWAEAKVYCDSLGADLINIETGREENVIEIMIRFFAQGHHVTDIPPDFWIGGIQMQGAGWKTETGEGMTFFDWLSPNGQDNYQGVQNCLAIRRNCFTDTCNEWGWFDDDCYQKKQFICEIRSCKGGCQRHPTADSQ